MLQQEYFHQVPVNLYDKLQSESKRKLTALLHQGHDGSCYVSRPILATPPFWLLVYAHKISHTLPTCNIILGWLTLCAPEAVHFVELLLIYQHFVLHKKNWLASPLYAKSKWTVSSAPLRHQDRNTHDLWRDVCLINLRRRTRWRFLKQHNTARLFVTQSCRKFSVSFFIILTSVEFAFYSVS